MFRELREEFPAEGRLPLSLNFRSQPAILDFVNACFAEELGAGLRAACGPTARRSAPRRPSSFFGRRRRKRRDERGERGEKRSEAAIRSVGRLAALVDRRTTCGPRERLRRREADWIARRIRDMIDAGEKIVWDEEAADGRPAGGSSGQAGRRGHVVPRLTNVEYYEEALRRYGIDYYLVGGHAFYAQQEIYDLLNLLRTLNSPCDEVSLAGVLRSPMFGLLRRDAVLAVCATEEAQGRLARRRRCPRRSKAAAAAGRVRRWPRFASFGP